MIIAALWKDSYKITVGDKECREIKTKEDEITCLPPASEPTDALADNPRVRVGKKMQLDVGSEPNQCIYYTFYKQ